MYPTQHIYLRRLAAPVLAAAAVLACARPGAAYIDRPVERLTLPLLLLEFKDVGLFEVDRVDLQRGAVRYRLVEAIQGRETPQTVKHVILYSEGVPEPLRGLRPGQRAVLFSQDDYRRGIARIGEGWYVSNYRPETGWWRLAYFGGNYDLNCCFLGGVEELAEACRTLLAGRTVTVRCRKRSRKEEAQWVRYDLRKPQGKEVVAGPAETAPAGATDLPDDAAGLIDRLGDEDAQARLDAADALGRLGEQAAGAAEKLAALVAGDGDVLVRRAAAVALGRIGAKARGALPALIDAVRSGYGDPSGLVGYEAAVAVARIDPAGTHAAKLLAERLQDARPEVRYRAAVAVRVMGPTLAPATPALVAALADAHQGVRYEAARALGEVAPDVRSALPALSRALRDKDRFVREAAGRSLQSLDPTAAEVAGLWVTLLGESPDATVRNRAAAALGDAATVTPAIEAALTRAAADADRHVRSQAKGSLDRLRRR
jgi:HEAT repeat protein